MTLQDLQSMRVIIFYSILLFPFFTFFYNNTHPPTLLCFLWQIFFPIFVGAAQLVQIIWKAEPIVAFKLGMVQIVPNIVRPRCSVSIMPSQCRDIGVELVAQQVQRVVRYYEGECKATKVQQVLDGVHAQARPWARVVRLVVKRVYMPVPSILIRRHRKAGYYTCRCNCRMSARR